MRQCLGLIVLLTVGLLLTGCGKSEEPTPTMESMGKQMDAAAKDAAKTVEKETEKAIAAPPTTQPTSGLNLGDLAKTAIVVNTKCPVGGEPIDPKDPKVIKFTYKNVSYGFCCAECLDPFKKDPEKYIAKLTTR